MRTPAEFARAALPHRTTAVITDPHEIANVLGKAGIRCMLSVSEGLPLDFYFMLPSCVPTTSLETSGAHLTTADLLPFLKHRRGLDIAEMMNYRRLARRTGGIRETECLLAHHDRQPHPGAFEQRSARMECSSSGTFKLLSRTQRRCDA